MLMSHDVIITHIGRLYTPGSSSETKMSTGCYYKFNGVR